MTIVTTDELEPVAFQRARSKDQIDLRRSDILNAARLLLERGDMADLTLTAIAIESGLVKSNIYRYFESREEILVCILIEEARDFVQALRKNYTALPRRNDVLLCAVVFAHTSADRRLFCQLTSAHASTLERNISVAKLQEMKLETAQLMAQAAALLNEAAPSLGLQKARQAIGLFLQMLAGLWPFANPKDNVAEAIKHPSLGHFNINFREHYARACYVMLLGVQSAGE